MAVPARHAMGDRFKHARESKELTIEEAASKTKVQAPYLRAIEDNRFGDLPGPVFAKGYVRAYARFLGMDEEESLRCFSDSAQGFYAEHKERERYAARQYADSRKRAINRNVVAFLTGIAVLALVFLLTQHQQPVSPDPEPVERPSPQESLPPAISASELETSPDTKLGVPGIVQGPVAIQGESEPLPAPLQLNEENQRAGEGAQADGHSAGRQEPLVLDVEAIELTWLMVQADGQAADEVLLRPGDEVSWKATDRLSVIVGNAGGVRMSLNGEPQPMLGKSGQVVRDLVFTRDDLRETAPAMQ